MSEAKIVVACVQAKAHDRDAFLEYLPEVLALIERASAQAELVVAPEGMVPAYFIGERPIDPKLIAQAEEAIKNIAKKHRSTLVYGTARLENEQTLNSAVVIGPDGSRLGHADKRFLWHFDRRWFTPGQTLEPIPTPVGRLGVLICADGRIPTLAATLVERGADLLVMPTAWVTSGRDPAALENVQADLFVPVRAAENGVPFIAANKVGVEAGSIAYCGKSLITDRNGMVLARASEREAEVIVHEVTLGQSHAPSRITLPLPGEEPTKRKSARIALTPSNDPHEVRSLAKALALADADLLIARTSSEERTTLPRLSLDSLEPDHASVAHAADVRIGIVGSRVLRDPRALVAARLAGIDLFAWPGLEDTAATIAFARTRAVELRAFVVTITPERAMACDPDGAIVCGTFDAYRAAAFTYDATRCEHTRVAPHTDILEGLRAAAAIAAR